MLWTNPHEIFFVHVCCLVCCVCASGSDVIVHSLCAPTHPGSCGAPAVQPAGICSPRRRLGSLETRSARVSIIPASVDERKVAKCALRDVQSVCVQEPGARVRTHPRFCILLPSFCVKFAVDLLVINQAVLFMSVLLFIIIIRTHSHIDIMNTCPS